MQTTFQRGHKNGTMVHKRKTATLLSLATFKHRTKDTYCKLEEQTWFHTVASSKDSLQDELPGINTARTRQRLYWTTTFSNPSENKHLKKKEQCHNDHCMAPRKKKKLSRAHASCSAFQVSFPPQIMPRWVLPGKNLDHPLSCNFEFTVFFLIDFHRMLHTDPHLNLKNPGTELSDSGNYGRSLGKGLLTTWMAVRFWGITL